MGWRARTILNQLTSKSLGSFVFIEYSVKYLYAVQKNDQFLKPGFFGNGVSGTSVCMCAYNLLALHSSFFNVDATWCEGELIHCFKDDQTCSTGNEHLKVMASTIEDDREDPFSLLEDSDVEEAALVVDSDDEADDL